MCLGYNARGRNWGGKRSDVKMSELHITEVSCQKKTISEQKDVMDFDFPLSKSFNINLEQK